MSKKLGRKAKIALISVSAALLVIVIVALAVFTPMKGKEEYDFWSPVTSEYAPVKTLVKEDGKDFKILQLTDIQLWTLAGDNDRAIKLVKDMVTEVKPDLIALTGDQVSGWMTTSLTRKLIKVMDSLETYWMPTFGNHESEGRADLNWIADRLSESKYCLFSRGPSNITGVGNFTVDLTDESGKTLWSFINIDSGNRTQYSKDYNYYSYINYDQIAWYEWVVKSLKEKNGGNTVPSMAFFHIALPEFKDALAEAHGVNIAEIGRDKIDEYIDGELPAEYEGGLGYIGEKVCSAPVNSGLFDKMLELGSTKEVFVGHDHANSAIVTYKGIRMAYGLKAGPSPKPWNDAPHFGGTLITIGENTVNVEHLKYDEADGSISPLYPDRDLTRSYATFFS